MSTTLQGLPMSRCIVATLVRAWTRHQPTGRPRIDILGCEFHGPQPTSNARRSSLLIIAFLAIAAFTGCATHQPQMTDAQRQFVAGQEEAFAMLQRSGIAIVRVDGPFQRPVLLWHEGMTLGEVILQAGYLDEHEPRQILIQRGAAAFEVDPDSLLQGKDTPVESGDVIHVLP